MLYLGPFKLFLLVSYIDNNENPHIKHTDKLRNNGSEGTDCIIPLLPKSGIAKMSFVIERKTVFCHYKKYLMVY